MCDSEAQGGAGGLRGASAPVLVAAFGRSAWGCNVASDPKPAITITRRTTVDHLLAPLQPYFKSRWVDEQGVEHHAEGAITDVAVNFPGSIFFEDQLGWHEVPCREITENWVRQLATAVSQYTRQEVSDAKPILSAELPDGERLQVLLPPAVEPGRASLTIRIPGGETPKLESYEERRMFERLKWANPFKGETAASDMRGLLERGDELMVEALEKRNVGEFFRLAVKTHKNIAVIGSTGSGKTTFMRCLCELISEHERILTVEDVRELFRGSRFRNTVHMLYSSGGQGVAQVTPAQLLASANRMKPDRVLLAELRGREAFDVLKLLTSGNKGLITSFHADNPTLGYDRMCLMASEHEEAKAYKREDLERIVRSTIDVMVHVTADLIVGDDGMPTGKDRYFTELYFDPVRKMKLALGGGGVQGVG
jgi:type IV secretion system protein VirB11